MFFYFQVPQEVYTLVLLNVMTLMDFKQDFSERTYIVIVFFVYMYIKFHTYSQHKKCSALLGFQLILLRPELKIEIKSLKYKIDHGPTFILGLYIGSSRIIIKQVCFLEALKHGI